MSRPTCEHQLEGCGANRLYCGKPARFHLVEWSWNLCGLHARFWLNRHMIVTEGTEARP